LGEWKYLSREIDTSIASHPLEDAEGFRMFNLSIVGDVVVGLSRDFRIRSWRLSTGKLMHDYEHDLRDPGSMGMSSDGTTLVYAGYNGRVAVWDIARPDRPRYFSISPMGTFTTIAISSNGNVVAVPASSDDAQLRETHDVQLWDTHSGRPILNIPVTGSAARLQFAASRRQFLVSTLEGDLTIYDTTTGKAVFQLPAKAGYDGVGAAISADGNSIAFVADETVHVWSVADESNRRSFGIPGHRMHTLSFSPDGDYLAATRHNFIKMFNVTTGRVGTQYYPSRGASATQFTAEGNEAVSVGGDDRVYTWSLVRQAPLRVLGGHGDGVRSVAFAPDGRRLTSSSYDKTIRIWDLATGEELAVLRGHGEAVAAVMFSPDGTKMVSVSDDKTIRVWDSQTGSELETLTGHTGRVISLAFSQCGRFIATGSFDGTARIWDIGSTEEIARLECSNHVKGLVFTANDRRLITATADGNVVEWDINTGNKLRTLAKSNDYLEAIALSRSSDFAAITSPFGLSVVPLENADAIRSMEGSDSISSVAISPDMTRIVCGLNDRSVGMWDTLTGEHVLALRGHQADVHSVAFSPDGTRIASGDLGGELRIWDSTPWRDRLAEYKAAKAAEPAAVSLVSKLYSELQNYKRVATKIKEDQSIDETLRHVALNVVLRQASRTTQTAVGDDQGS